MTSKLTEYLDYCPLGFGIQSVEFQTESPLQVDVGLLRKQVDHRVVLVLQVLLNLGTGFLLILLLQEGSLFESFDACLGDNASTLVRIGRRDETATQAGREIPKG